MNIQSNLLYNNEQPSANNLHIYRITHVLDEVPLVPGSLEADRLIVLGTTSGIERPDTNCVVVSNRQAQISDGTTLTIWNVTGYEEPILDGDQHIIRLWRWKN